MCMYAVPLRRVLDTIFCSGKAIIITYSECMSVALVIQDAMLMYRIILLYVACLTLYFSTLLYKRHDLPTKKLNLKCAS